MNKEDHLKRVKEMLENLDNSLDKNLFNYSPRDSKMNTEEIVEYRSSSVNDETSQDNNLHDITQENFKSVSDEPFQYINVHDMAEDGFFYVNRENTKRTRIYDMTDGYSSINNTQGNCKKTFFYAGQTSDGSYIFRSMTYSKIFGNFNKKPNEIILPKIYTGSSGDIADAVLTIPVCDSKNRF